MRDNHLVSLLSELGKLRLHFFLLVEIDRCLKKMEFLAFIASSKEIKWTERQQMFFFYTVEINIAFFQSLLHNFWKKGLNSMNRGITEAPHAWVIPADQRDPSRLATRLSSTWVLT